MGRCRVSKSLPAMVLPALSKRLSPKHFLLMLLRAIETSGKPICDRYPV